jgi:hypothetical protein
MPRHPVNTACNSPKEYRNKKIKEKEGKIAYCSKVAISEAHISRKNCQKNETDKIDDP